MSYAAKDYSSLLGMKGFSETLLKNHFILYQGYVTNTNKAADALAQMLKDGKTAAPEFAELKRRFGWEFNGMRLHELYFENSRAAAPRTSPAGSRRSWKKGLRRRRRMGEGISGPRGAMRGIGWWRFTTTLRATGSITAGSTSMTLRTSRAARPS